MKEQKSVGNILLELGIVTAISVPILFLMNSCIPSKEELQAELKETGVFMERGETHRQINIIKDPSTGREFMQHVSFVDEKTGRVCVAVSDAHGRSISVDCEYPKEVKQCK